jgi:short-subunit dehydrogenase
MKGKQRLAGKMVIITDASQGMGRVSALAYAHDIPMLVSRSNETLQTATAEIRDNHPVRCEIALDFYPSIQIARGASRKEITS